MYIYRPETIKRFKKIHKKIIDKNKILEERDVAKEARLKELEEMLKRSNEENAQLKRELAL